MQVVYTPQGSEHVEHAVELWKSHFDDLKEMYATSGEHPADQVLTRIFAMVTRYDSISEDKSANQAALPRPMMRTLQDRLGVDFECYASPLNRYKHFSMFCSAWFDTDRYFGSVGAFQSFRPQSGSFEANPPFDNASVCACFQHISQLLGAADGPMSYVVVIPTMDHSPSLGAAYATCAPYAVRTAAVPSGQHAYLMGLQHRRTGVGGGEEYWWPEKGSQIYFLQNELGSARWPVTEAVIAELLAAFDPRSAAFNVTKPLPHDHDAPGYYGDGGGYYHDANDLSARGDAYGEGIQYESDGSLDLEEMMNIAACDRLDQLSLV